MLPLRVRCLANPKFTRPVLIARAMAEGVKLHGDVAEYATDFTDLNFDVLVAYGRGHWSQAFNDAWKAGKPTVFFDLGYFDRHDNPADPTGCYRLALDGWHAVVDFAADPSRISKWLQWVAPWRRNGVHILVAGMSEKSALDNGFAAAEEWEAATIARLRLLTGRPIVYRPKPTWRGFNPSLALISPPTESIRTALTDCWAVVTHHSNVAVDALAHGVPIFTEEGAALPLSSGSIDLIERPAYPSNRQGFFAGLGWCNWSLGEMRSGDCWAYVRQMIA